ncbi:hypothetical protein J3R83DRAFT_11884 [Lanmaoa asiatica]|nr:hypothetical protein J3R83DRAFT_11884 [Lanmaoa asiatica]
MGPSHARDQKLAQDDVKALLREKDDGWPSRRVWRRIARVRRLPTARLLKTIDVLDALRSQHALEISAEEQAKMKLVHEVDRWRSMAKNLEVEKDELKDVVEDLIEKVQVSNEWSSWPCSQMRITKHAGVPSFLLQTHPRSGGNLNVEFPEQVTAGAIDGGGTKDECDDDLLAYATSIIARLRMELDLERQNHNRTVEEANLRIEELEAKVAVREAELESCITLHGGLEHRPDPENVSAHTFEKRKLGERLPKPKPLSDEECLRFLESNNARNRSLELEIRHIAEKLEQARMAASTSSGPLKEPQSPISRNGHKVIPTPSPRTRSASVDPNALSRPLDTGKTTSTPALASPSTMLSIAQLDNQIRTMATQMEALASERTTLIEAAARQRRARDGINIDTFQDVLRVEGECVRLQAEVDDLREQLQHARSFARGREKALLLEIAQLRASSSSSSALRPAHDLHRIFSPQPLEDDVATEESMELASPLMPTVVSDPNTFPAPPFHDPDTETDLVLFPFSPKHGSSPAPESPLTSPRITRRSPSPQDIERVQAALDAARTHLAQKEEALTQLRAEMEGLQLKVQAQTHNDGNGDGG